jgi:hypothetical protein
MYQILAPPGQPPYRKDAVRRLAMEVDWQIFQRFEGTTSDQGRVRAGMLPMAIVI